MAHKKAADDKQGTPSYREIFNAASDMMIIQDIETGAVIDVNDSTCIETGYTREEYLLNGLQITSPKKPEYAPEKALSYIKRAITEGPQLFEWAYIDKQGEFHYTEVHLKVGTIEGRKRLIGVVRDISERKQLEELLQKDKQTLEKLVSEKTAELSKTQQMLEQSRRLSDIGMLSSFVAHELRNPLYVIKLAVYNIRKKKILGDTNKFLDNIDKKITECDQIISNLLGYSKLKKPRFQQIRFFELLNEIIVNIESKYQSQDITLIKHNNFDSDLTIEADKLQMTELFSNILDNAFRSMKNKKGSIILDFKVNTEKNKVQFICKDTGDGIEKTMLKKIYEPFFTNKKGGIGLGLPICKQIVEFHQGTIKITSKVGEGTQTEITLPLIRKPE